MSESLQISREGRVLELALNRPERRNALNMDLCSALGAAPEEAENDAGVGAVLLSGNGKSFCLCAAGSQPARGSQPRSPRDETGGR
jgi:enoyl-CoA hydratase/carnithine racemase